MFTSKSKGTPLAHQVKVGVLVSGGGSNLQAILDACVAGRIDARVVFAGADNPAAGGLERARKQRVSTFVVDYTAIHAQYRQDRRRFTLPTDCDWEYLLRRQRLRPIDDSPEQLASFFVPRLAAEDRLLNRIAQYRIDLLVLGGFMRTLTPYFIDKFNPNPKEPRIMNIHPSLLPAFPGVDGYGETFRYGCRVGGCTVHFVDYGEDTGPIIGQRTFTIEPGDTLDAVRRRGLALEWELYPECIQLFAEKRLRVVEKRYPQHHGRMLSRRVVEISRAD
jgi:phosphoribosylglycinamide formyltransferase-1